MIVSGASIHTRANSRLLAPSRSRAVMAAPQVNPVAPDRIGDLLVKEGLITGSSCQRPPGAKAERDAPRLLPGEARLRAGSRADQGAGEAAQDAGGGPVAVRDGSQDREDVPSELARSTASFRSSATGARSPSRWPTPSHLGVLEDLKFITRYDIFPVLAGEFTLRSSDRQGVRHHRRRADGVADGHDQPSSRPKSARRRGRRGRGRGHVARLRSRRRWKTRPSSS